MGISNPSSGALAASENHLGEVGGNSTSISLTPTITASSAYGSSDCIGGKLTLANAMRVSGGTGLLQSIQVIDKSNNKSALVILLFNADPTSATITDKTAFAYSTDTSKQIRAIQVVNSDYVTINGVATADISVGSKVIKTASGTTLYAAVVLNASTPTFASASDFTISFGILRD
jgi:hypothetical protein